MASIMSNLSHAAERQAFSVMLDAFWKNLSKKEDRTETYLKLVDTAERFWKDSNHETMNRIREYLSNPENRWVKFLNRVIDETNPNYAKKMLLNLGYEAFFRGTKTIRANREKYHCNIPWLILCEPTDAFNIHCVGCWSGTYGHNHNFSFEYMDKIVSQG